MRTLAEWLTLQESVHPKSIDMELTRVTAVARALGIAEPAFPVVTVGGTNGKGSTVAHLAALLGALGASTGMFTSPHFIRYNERIRVNGEEVADRELIAAFERIEAARGATTLTFFEYNTLAALLIFAQRAVDVAVLEVGLGGRLDATNLVAADVAVVASVGFDHRDWLGDTLELIGAEKAGIFRPGKPAVLGTPDMPASVFATIGALGARALIAERDFTWRVSGERWDYDGLGVSLRALPPPALAGAIQYRNAATAIAALEALGADAAPRARAGTDLRRHRRAGGQGRRGDRRGAQRRHRPLDRVRAAPSARRQRGAAGAAPRAPRGRDDARGLGRRRLRAGARRGAPGRSGGGVRFRLHRGAGAAVASDILTIPGREIGRAHV